MTIKAPVAKLIAIDDAKLQIAVWLEAKPNKQEAVINDRVSSVDRLLAQASDILLSWGIDDEVDTHASDIVVGEIVAELAE